MTPEAKKISDVDAMRNASERLGWRANAIEASAKAISDQMRMFLGEAEVAKFNGYLGEIVRAVRDSFMQETGGKSST